MKHVFKTYPLIALVAVLALPAGTARAEGPAQAPAQQQDDLAAQAAEKAAAEEAIARARAEAQAEAQPVDEEARPAAPASAAATIDADRVPANVPAMDPDEEEDSAPAQQAGVSSAPETPKNAYELEVLGFKDYGSLSAIRKQLETVVERNAVLTKKRASYGSALYVFRTALGSNEVQRALQGLQLGDTRLKSVSFNKNRFTVEVQ